MWSMNAAGFAGFIMPAIDMASTVGIHRITNPSDRLAWIHGYDVLAPAPA